MIPIRIRRACVAAGSGAALVGAFAGCPDGERVTGNSGLGETPGVGAIASDPVSSAASGLVGERLLRGSTVGLVYVSLVPGAVPDGWLATIRNVRTGEALQVPMTDGGFDPVPLEAVPEDLLEVTVALSVASGTATFSMRAPRVRRPRVVRTVPARRKRDVALNSTITVVFTEPIRASTASNGIQLLRNGAAVPGQVTVSPDGLRAELRPNQHLMPNTDYVMSVSTQITDRSGARLEEAVLVEFTTGTSLIVASVVTDPGAILVTEGGDVRTFAMRASLDDKGTVTGDFVIHYPESGVRVIGDISCFTIVDGRKAWLAGVITASSNPDAIGLPAKWRAVDNGSPSLGARDELSYVYQGELGAAFGTNEEFCVNTPERSPQGEEMLLHALTSGDIIVNPAGGAAPPAPAGLAEIAYAAWPDGGIQVINADGTGGRLLTRLRGDWNPEWSPDGSMIAFDRREDTWGAGDIYVIRADGSGVRQLTSGPPNDVEPQWSPDGTQIAFARDGGIHVMDARDGSKIKTLSSSGDGHPAWAPDGKRIAFMSWRDGTNEIYVMNVDGSGVRRLTREADDWFPSWSPDGRSIAFERIRNGVSALYVVAADAGTSPVQLALGGRTPSWSPDGQRILYEYYGMTEINVDGSGMAFLGHGFDPSWSPVGRLPTRPAPFLTVEKAGGDAQSGAVGTRLPAPLTVRVLDDHRSPVPGVNVAWFLLWAGEPEQPHLSSHFARTGADGVASVELTLGSYPGPLTVRAAVRDGTARNPGVEFTATAIP